MQKKEFLKTKPSPIFKNVSTLAADQLQKIAQLVKKKAEKR